jgi:serine/threonine protein phosphatase 1
MMPGSTLQPGAYDTGGRLVYAIGDIHGRADLLRRMIQLIATDIPQHMCGHADRPAIVFLGDYIDRGRQSREALDLVLALKADTDLEVRCLLGNHEEAMLDFLDRRTSGVGWANHGGKETIQSYGIPVPHHGSKREAWSLTRSQLLQQVPASHLDFLRNLELMIVFNDILFVHAGVRPSAPLDTQSKRDMLWIRSEFIDHEEWLGKLIVHGHTPVERAFLGQNRICLDTGAYASGLLSAARFDGGPPTLLEIGGRI